MKKIIIPMFVLFFSFRGIAQQNISLKQTATIKPSAAKGTKGTSSDSITVKKADTAEEEKIFGVYGAGNLNKEQLEKFNASGKFSCYIRPMVTDNSNLTFYLSFNMNATNSDSLLASTLIFPEIGNNSFLGTAEYTFLLKTKNPKPNQEHFIVPFLEFSNKNIKASQDTGNAKSVGYHFSTLNYTIGCKYLFHYRKTVDKTANDVYFSMAGYLSYLNIPNQDTADYRILLKSKTITDNLLAAGIKVAVQYNNFSIFADFRHVLGSEKRIPVRELRGFNSNIGVVFNAEIFGL